MRIGSTIIVLIIAGVGVAALWRGGWSGSSQNSVERLGVEGRRLLSQSDLPIDQLTRITLTRSDQPALVFERLGATWNQREPFVHPMDPFSIRQLAQQALDLTLIDLIEPGDLEGGLSKVSLGLQPPLAAILFEWPGGTLKLNLGRRSVAGRAFLQIDQESRICIVNHRLHERALEMDDKEWRSRVIFPEAGIDSMRIQWSNGPARMALVRERKQWMMVEPVRTRLDPAKRDQYMDALGRAASSGFILDQPRESDLANFGLIDSPLTIEITGESDRQRLVIGMRAGGGTQDFFGIVEGRPVVVRISGAVLAALFRQPQDLAAHTGSGTVPADVKTIVIRHTASGEDLALERDLEKWRITQRAGASSPPGEGASSTAREVNGAHVQELLDQLTQLRAVNVQFVDQYPRDLEIATITLHGFDGKAIDTIRIVREPSTERWGMENGDNVIRWHPASLEMRLTADAFGVN